MNRKLIFFDIDGTLVSFKTHKVPQSTIDALNLLREKGIKIFCGYIDSFINLFCKCLIWNLMVMSADVERIFILMERKSIPL